MNFIYFTEKFKRQIADTAHEDIVYERILKLKNYESFQGTNTIDKYGKVYVYKLKGTLNSRILFVEEKLTVHSETINFLFILYFVAKKSFDYKWGNVIYPTLVDGTWLNENPLSQDDIENAKIQYIEFQTNNNVSKPFPPQEITEWLDNFSAKTKFDILEFEDWTSYSSNPATTGLEEKYLLLVTIQHVGVLIN